MCNGKSSLNWKADMPIRSLNKAGHSDPILLNGKGIA